MMEKFVEILKACASGEMPKVCYTGKLRHHEYQDAVHIGNVVTIRAGLKHRGVAVQFTGLNYEVFFYAEDGTDKRSRYCRELEIVHNAAPGTIV